MMIAGPRFWSLPADSSCRSGWQESDCIRHLLRSATNRASQFVEFQGRAAVRPGFWRVPTLGSMNMYGGATVMKCDIAGGDCMMSEMELDLEDVGGMVLLQSANVLRQPNVLVRVYEAVLRKLVPEAFIEWTCPVA